MYNDSNISDSSLSCHMFWSDEEEDDELPLEWDDDEVVEDCLRDACTKVGISIVFYGCLVWLLSWIGIAI